MGIRFRRAIAVLLVVSVGWMGLPLPVQAGIVATEGLVRPVDRERIANMLGRAEIRAQFEAYGISEADIKGRLAALTDEEVAQLANQIERAPAGGYSEALHFLGGVLAIILLVVYAFFMMSR